jgi:hypothetical protein
MRVRRPAPRQIRPPLWSRRKGRDEEEDDDKERRYARWEGTGNATAASYRADPPKGFSDVAVG